MAGCDGQGEDAPDAVAAERASHEPAYTGRASCVECHPAQVAAFEGSHHDLAGADPASTPPLGDFEAAHYGGPGERARFSRRADAYLVEATGPAGEPAQLRVAWTLGAEPLQQLLLPAPGGRLQAFGVAWERGRAGRPGRWFSLYPDAAPGDPVHWTGYEQTANHQCLECHTTGFVKGYDPDTASYDTRWAEGDVSCEACHGPASRHLEWARKGVGGDPRIGRPAGSGTWHFADGASIARRVDPDVPAASELEVCARCHARRERFSDADSPLEPFLESHRPALLDAALYHADGQPREEVYVWGSFLQSRMAAAGVTCGDCHEPHSLALRAEGNALCGRCHEPARYDAVDHHRHEPGSSGARCTSCHMPAALFMAVDARREHAFRVPRPDRSEQLGAPDACSSCHTSRTPAWAAAQIEAWFGPERPAGYRYPEALWAARALRPEARERLLDLIGDAREPAIARATALRELEPHLDAGALPALEAGLADRDPLVRMAAAQAVAAIPPELRPGLLAASLSDGSAAVRLEAARSLAGAGARLSAEDRDALARGLSALRAAARRNADRPEAQLALAELAAAQGRLEDARRRAEEALRLDPASVPAAVNLADLHRQRGRDDLAGQVLLAALEREPGSAELHYSLGLLRVRERRYPEAGQLLARADDLAGDGRFAYAHGLFLAERGRAAAAFPVLEAGLERRPGDRALLVALATLERDRGDRPAARRYAERLVRVAPADPAARALLASLEGETP